MLQKVWEMIEAYVIKVAERYPKDNNLIGFFHEKTINQLGSCSGKFLTNWVISVLYKPKKMLGPSSVVCSWETVASNPLTLPCLALLTPVMPCPALPCNALSYPAALPCLVKVFQFWGYKVLVCMRSLQYYAVHIHSVRTVGRDSCQSLYVRLSIKIHSGNISLYWVILE